MISKFEELKNLFEEIDKSLAEKVNFHIIGGAVMLYHGLKTGTKDIDIVVDSPKEFSAAEKAFKKVGFSTRTPAFEYSRVELNKIFTRGEFRIDLFQRTVCKGFQLSDSMKKRALEITGLKHLTISLCSNEDVFLFKTFTEREGDIDDCIALARRGIDWNAVLEELERQIKLSGNKIWITWVGERLDILEERGLAIPIMQEVNKLRKDYFNKYGKRTSSWK
ncbi:MAG: hypothetical protein HY518_02665 [Candidatus Aenigmarchaeota archaeon]|nr:hypothetical protein [Candidatus Aenigmarchaeota archaeon]